MLWFDSWGFEGCIGVTGDYDGDGAYDQAIYHEASGLWWIKRIDGTIILWEYLWGGEGRKPVGTVE